MGEAPQNARFDLGQSLAALAGRKAALIYMHDNPDPDALAAGLGLGRLFEHELGTSVTLGHGGIVGRAQNRAMVETLGIQLAPVDRLKPDAFDLIALVDSQPETGNNSLPPGHCIDVVIDHHPARPCPRSLCRRTGKLPGADPVRVLSTGCRRRTCRTPRVDRRGCPHPARCRRFP